MPRRSELLPALLLQGMRTEQRSGRKATMHSLQNRCLGGRVARGYTALIGGLSDPQDRKMKREVNRIRIAGTGK